MPKIFGILLVIAGAGYLVDGFGAVLVQDYPISIGAFTFVGEVALIFWLLISGTPEQLSPRRHPPGPTPPQRRPPEVESDPTTAPVG